MRKLKGLSLMLVLSSMVFAGCSLGGEAPSTDLLQESVVNSAKNMTSANYDLSISGEIDTQDATVGVVDFDVNFSGDVDMSDLANPLMALAIDANFSAMEYEDQFAKGELRISGDTIYMMLEELSDFNGELPSEMVSEFLGTWWSYTDEYGSMQMMGMDEEAKAEMIAALESVELFTNVKYEGTETLLGEKTYEFTADLNKESYKQFMIDQMAATGYEPSESELEEIDMVFEYFDMKGSYFVGVEDGMMHGFDGVISVNVPEEDVDVDINFDYKISKINEAVSIEEPADAQDLGAMMGGMMGGMGAYDTYDYDMDMEYDMGDLDMELDMDYDMGDLDMELDMDMVEM